VIGVAGSGLGWLTPDQSTNFAPPLHRYSHALSAEVGILATPLPILTTATSGTVERRSLRCGHLSLDDDDDRVRCFIHRFATSRRPGRT
jgi:hypothetical protein